MSVPQTNAYVNPDNILNILLVPSSTPTKRSTGTSASEGGQMGTSDGGIKTSERGQMRTSRGQTPSSIQKTSLHCLSSSHIDKHDFCTTSTDQGFDDNHNDVEISSGCLPAPLSSRLSPTKHSPTKLSPNTDTDQGYYSGQKRSKVKKKRSFRETIHRTLAAVTGAPVGDNAATGNAKTGSWATGSGAPCGIRMRKSASCSAALQTQDGRYIHRNGILK